MSEKAPNYKEPKKPNRSVATAIEQNVRFLKPKMRLEIQNEQEIIQNERKIDEMNALAKKLKAEKSQKLDLAMHSAMQGMVDIMVQHMREECGEENRLQYLSFSTKDGEIAYEITDSDNNTKLTILFDPKEETFIARASGNNSKGNALFYAGLKEIEFTNKSNSSVHIPLNKRLTINPSFMEGYRKTMSYIEERRGKAEKSKRKAEEMNAMLKKMRE